MYDSITCILPEARISPDRVFLDHEGRGTLRNLRVKQVPEGVLFKGSLGKFLHGENITTLTLEEVKEALVAIESALGLPLGGGRVRSLEIGATFRLQKPPSCYLAAWGSLPRHKKMTCTGKNGLQTVLFFTKAHSFQGYDKNAESKISSGIDHDRFYLRLELKIHRGMKEMFGDYLSPWELTELDPYLQYRQLWAKYYFKILKQPQFVLNTSTKTSKQFEQYLAAYGLQSLGLDRALTLIREGQVAGCIDRVNASRIRSNLREMIQDTRISSTDEHTAELDDKVNEMLRAVP